MKLVFIGSACADVTIEVDHLPSLEEDVNGIHQEMHLGGCAHNATHAAGLFHVPFLLASPVGTGLYGNFVRSELKKEGLRYGRKQKKPMAAAIALRIMRGIVPLFHCRGQNITFINNGWIR